MVSLFRSLKHGRTEGTEDSRVVVRLVSRSGQRTICCTVLTGSRGTLVGDARGDAPLARRSPDRRETSEGARVQARTPCRMPPHQPAGMQSER